MGEKGNTWRVSVGKPEGRKRLEELDVGGKVVLK
jgi:hypothetical protein